MPLWKVILLGDEEYIEDEVCPVLVAIIPDIENDRQAKEKYDDVTLTGHSLGGQLALHTARRHDAQSIVFNPGSSPFAEPFHAAMCSAFNCGYTKT